MAARPDRVSAMLSAVARQIPVMAEEEERRLVQEMRSGSKRARELLVRSQLRYVHQIASIWAKKSKGVFYEECFAAGCVGACIAVDRFDPSKDCRLVTYATHWIRLKMRAAARATLSVVDVPKAITARVIDDNVAALRVARGLLDPAPRADDALAEVEERQEIAHKVSNAGLSAREKRLVDARLMCAEDEAVTLQALGDGWGVSKEWVRIVQLSTLKKLRRAFGAPLVVAEEPEAPKAAVVESDRTVASLVGLPADEDAIREAARTITLSGRDVVTLEKRLLRTTAEAMSLAELGLELGLSPSRMSYWHTRLVSRLRVALGLSDGGLDITRKVQVRKRRTAA